MLFFVLRGCCSPLRQYYVAGFGGPGKLCAAGAALSCAPAGFFERRRAFFTAARVPRAQKVSPQRKASLGLPGAAGIERDRQRRLQRTKNDSRTTRAVSWAPSGSQFARGAPGAQTSRKSKKCRLPRIPPRCTPPEGVPDTRCQAKAAGGSAKLGPIFVRGLSHN